MRERGFRALHSPGSAPTRSTKQFAIRRFTASNPYHPSVSTAPQSCTRAHARRGSHATRGRPCACHHSSRRGLTGARGVWPPSGKQPPGRGRTQNGKDARRRPGAQHDRPGPRSAWDEGFTMFRMVHECYRVPITHALAAFIFSASIYFPWQVRHSQHTSPPRVDPPIPRPVPAMEGQHHRKMVLSWLLINLFLTSGESSL